MAISLGWKSNADTRDIVHIVVQALVEGKLVALPTETAYHVVASALDVNAVQQMAQLLEAGKVDAPALLLRSSEEALDYAPSMSRVARRAVYRGWPGPLVLELPVDSHFPPSQKARSEPIDCEASLAFRLPDKTRELLLEDKFLAQRVVPHEVVVEAMRLTPGPLIAAPCVDANQQSVNLPADAESRLGGDVPVLVDDGETHFGGFAARIRVENNVCTIITPGVIEESKRNKLFHLVVLLVCTGNTCRSPMAEVLLADLLNKAFPSQFKQDKSLAYVASAGLSAFPGGPASPEAQCVMERRGLSLRNHQSRAVTEQSLRHADLILTMTRSHRSAIVGQMPELENRVRLLSGSPEDVADPFGGSESVYAECADQIEGFLSNWVSKMDDTWFPVWRTELS